MGFRCDRRSVEVQQTARQFSVSSRWEISEEERVHFFMEEGGGAVIQLEKDWISAVRKVSANTNSPRPHGFKRTLHTSLLLISKLHFHVANIYRSITKYRKVSIFFGISLSTHFMNLLTGSQEQLLLMWGRGSLTAQTCVWAEHAGSLRYGGRPLAVRFIRLNDGPAYIRGACLFYF